MYIVFLAGEEAVSRRDGQGSNILCTILGTQGTLLFWTGNRTGRPGRRRLTGQSFMCYALYVPFLLPYLPNTGVSDTPSQRPLSGTLERLEKVGSAPLFGLNGVGKEGGPRRGPKRSRRASVSEGCFKPRVPTLRPQTVLIDVIAQRAQALQAKAFDNNAFVYKFRGLILPTFRRERTWAIAM